MKFCIICPTAGLERYATLSTTHLVLAQIKDRAYHDFYLKRREAGDTIILDNGAYEAGTAMPEREFVNMATFYKPQWIVCPDNLFERWEHTYSRTKNFLDKYYDILRNLGCRFMGVPQTTKGDILGWIEGLLTMMDDLPLDGVGLPRALVTHYYPDPMTRVNATKLLRKRYSRHIKGLYIHAFGMANGDVNELQPLADAGCDSIDSSAPVWRGWMGKSNVDPRDREWWNMCGVECGFDAPNPPDHNNCNRIHRQILSNLEACGVDISSAR